LHRKVVGHMLDFLFAGQILEIGHAFMVIIKFSNSPFDFFRRGVIRGIS
jgi:hypothetical protein